MYNRVWVDTNRNWAGAAKKDYTPLEEREDWDGKVEVMPTAFEFDRTKTRSKQR